LPNTQDQGLRGILKWIQPYTMTLEKTVPWGYKGIWYLGLKNISTCNLYCQDNEIMIQITLKQRQQSKVFN